MLAVVLIYTYNILLILCKVIYLLVEHLTYVEQEDMDWLKSNESEGFFGNILLNYIYEKE